jgi:hypothetical protein
MKQLQAFPVSYNGRDGMTLRDYFAVNAMLGVITSAPNDETLNMRNFSQWSYMVADAMLKAREE